MADNITTAERQLLTDYQSLYAAYARVDWHPREKLPPEVTSWLSVSHLLLRFCERLLDKVEEAPGG